MSVIGGWGEKGLEMENCQSPGQTSENAPSLSLLVHPMLASALRSLPSPLQHYLLQATLINLLARELSNLSLRAAVYFGIQQTTPQEIDWIG